MSASTPAPANSTASTANMILDLALEDGPALITGVTNLVGLLKANGTLTQADVDAEFAPLKSYAQYAIPNAAPQ